MEALQAKKRQESHHSTGAAQPTKSKDSSAKKKEKVDGAESDGEDSFDSAEYVRTKEDNDFIDADDDDPDALQELYAEQHFGDDHPEMEDNGKKKKKGSSRKSRGDDGEREGGGRGSAEADLDNPIMAAVHRMKKKKRDQKKFDEIEEEVKEFIRRMERVAEDDLEAIKERRPALAKLSMLPQVVDMLAKRDMIRVMLDHDILSVCKIWIQPLPNGSLGNVTVRQELIQAIRKVQEINTDDLKRSEIGKVIMTLFMHPSETPALKREMKALIEQWSRPIFQKSGNMKDLEHFQQSRQRALHATVTAPREAASNFAVAPSKEADLQSMITSGSRGASSADQGNRVRIPYSKGFQYTVRPTAKPSSGESQAKGGPKEGVRNNLVKRILEKGRPVAKNHRSANVSIEGRQTK
jgi:transcription factor SPN1